MNLAADKAPHDRMVALVEQMPRLQQAGALTPAEIKIVEGAMC